jgi:hypothetical protein
MRNRSIQSGIIAWALLTGIVLASYTGCAKIADPQPPWIRIPKPSTDLAARQISNSITLSVSLPVLNTNGSPASTLRMIEVFRIDEAANSAKAPQPLSEEEFLKLAARIQSIPSPQFIHHLQDNAFVVQDPIQIQAGSALDSHAFRYALRFVNNKNQSAGLSNQVRIAPVPIPLPPEGLSAEVTNYAIQLKWTAPLENMDGSKPPRIAGYNLYRAEESPKLPAAPINSTPLQTPEFEDRNFQFDRTYTYAVSIVGNNEHPHAETLPSKTCIVVARDIFPPTPPSDFTALLDGGNIVLLWTPSTSEDVAGYRLYRQNKDGSNRQLLQKELITTFSFREARMEAPKDYEYRIQAVDTHGNASTEVQTEVEIRSTD